MIGLTFMKHKRIFPILTLAACIFAVSSPAFSGFFGKKNNQKTNGETLRHIEMNIDGESRSFEVFVPQTASKKTMPTIIAFHGGGGGGSQMAKSSELIATARKHNFIIIFPNGNGKKDNILLTWNARHCCGYAIKNKTDDIKFISQTIDYATNNLGADKSRIYLTGISNGAMMTHNAAIALSPKIAAIATVVGTMFGDEAFPSAPVPALIMNGAIDDHIPLNGGPPQKNAYAWDGKPMKPAIYQSQFWAKANNCAPNAAKSENNKIIEYNYSCPVNADVKHIIVKDGGHEWFGGKAGRPRKGKPSQSYDANEEMVHFFLEHSK